MLIIEPVKQFLVERHLNNPSDLATYYCKATITNSITGVVIDSFNLTNNGNKYFSKVWQTPNDASGTGLQITISVTAYEDSGYTTESVVYGTEKTTYIVRSLAGSRIFGGYAGQGRDQRTEIDYKKIEKMIFDAVQGIRIPEQKEYDDSIVLDELDSIKNSVKGIPDRSQEIISAIRFSPEFKTLKNVVSGFKEAEKSDDELHSFVEKVVQQIAKDTDNFKGEMTKEMASVVMEEFKNKVIQDLIDTATFEFRNNIKKTMTEATKELSSKMEEIMSRSIPIKLTLNDKNGEDMTAKREPKQVESPHANTISQLLNGY